MLVAGKLGEALHLVRMCGFFGFGRNPCRFGTDAVTLASVAIPSWRASGVPLPYPPKRTRENPRTYPGNNVVFFTFLLAGVAWYVASQSCTVWLH
jgi:hypothetical protein